jgi:hypothetical protein
MLSLCIRRPSAETGSELSPNGLICLLMHGFHDVAQIDFFTGRSIFSTARQTQFVKQGGCHSHVKGRGVDESAGDHNGDG